MSSIKQKKVLENIIENHVEVSTAMIEAGYSLAYSSNPQEFTNTKLWQELMEKHFPDGKLALKIEEGLEATKVISAIVINKKSSPTSQALGEGLPDANSQTNDFIDVPDYAVRHKYVETALKLKNKMPVLGDTENPFKVDITIDIGTTLKKIYGQRNNGGSGEVLKGSS